MLFLLLAVWLALLEGCWHFQEGAVRCSGGCGEPEAAWFARGKRQAALLLMLRACERG